MKNFEVQHTLRLYDPEFVAAIGRMFEVHKNHYHSKNEFMTDLVKLGLKELSNRFVKKQPITAIVDTTETTDSDAEKIVSLLNELSKYMSMQFKRTYINHKVLTALLSSVYNILLGVNDDERVLTEKAHDGFYDDLPTRFEKIIINLEHKYGLR